MSLGLSALVIVGGILIGRLVARVVRARRPRGKNVEETAPLDGIVPDAFAAFPCALGDVIVRRIERDEAWLAGALLFSEDRPIAALFVAPEAREDRALFVREAALEIAWLSPLVGGIGIPGREPPSSIEHHGVRFERRRRLPVRVDMRGSGCPSVGESAVVAEYEGPGMDRMVVVLGTRATLAWRGVMLAEGAYDVLPGGPSTLA